MRAATQTVHHTAERLLRIRSFRWFSSHSYENWLHQHEQLYRPFGFKPPACDTATPIRVWREWIFHPVWRYAWADQEELHYWVSVKGEVLAIRDAVQRRAWAGLQEKIQHSHDQYRPPVAAWRFYIQLPLVDRVVDQTGKSSIPARQYPYPAFVNAPFTTMKHLTWHEMVKAVVALKRYKLRHGEWPPTLAALTPELLPATPRDFMDGHELRYRSQPNGSFTLYSVGENIQDDRGDPTPSLSNQSSPRPFTWDGRDWVWPQNVTRSKTEAGRQRVRLRAPSTARSYGVCVPMLPPILTVRRRE